MTKRKYRPEGALISTYENRENTASEMAIERAMENGTILEAIALMCDNDLCLHFSFGGIKAVMKKEECLYCRENESIKDIAILTRVGKPVCFKVIGAEKDENGKTKNFYLSRRLAQEECMRHYIDNLNCGDIIPAKVTHLEGFGAFLDVGCGISSLLTVDSISVSRISHPKDRLACGTALHVVVKSRDNESGRIFVSLKELLGTWEENSAFYEAGQTVTGIVRSVESYGIFIELAPNLAGLAEAGGCTLTDIKEYSELLGKRVSVYIKSIIPERMKIKLVIIDRCRAEIPDTVKREKLRYFIDPEETEHIDNWIYSPATAQKRIESYF